MDKTKLKAIILTAVIIGIVAFIVVPKPIDWVDGIKETISSRITSKEKPKKEQSKQGQSISSADSKKQIDSYKGVAIYHNGNLKSVHGRNISKDGYNLGLRYQCVEFVKRFYFEYFNHKMPNDHGHAHQFYNKGLKDGDFNKDRGLKQYRNGSKFQPQNNAILIFDKDAYTAFGHMGIITKVTDSSIEMASQNNGKNQKPRSVIPMIANNGIYKINHPSILGWLSK